MSRAWAAAAILATTEVTEQGLQASKSAGLQAWLQQHGQQVSSISISTPDPEHPRSKPVALQLPGPELEHVESLDLAGARLLFDLGFTDNDWKKMSPAELTAMAESKAVAFGIKGAVQPPAPFRRWCEFRVMMKLQRLRLVACKVPEWQLLQLCRATCLTSITLHGVGFTNGQKGTTQIGRRGMNFALHDLLQGLPNVTELTLTEVSVKAGPADDIDDSVGSLPPVLAAVSQMQRLQRLTTDEYFCESLHTVWHYLPASLTYLKLSGVDIAPWKASAVQGAAQLSNLQHLQVSTLALIPSVLTHWRSLTHLSVEGALLSHTAAEYNDAAAEYGDVDFDPANRAALQARDVERLLAAVAQLTELQHLRLAGICTFDSGLVGAQAYSALTASSKLTTLEVLAEDHRMPLVREAFAHMLPQGRQLPHLRRLWLDGGGDIYCGPGYGVDTYEPPCIFADDMQRIGASCPGLTCLKMTGGVMGGNTYALLTLLPPSLLELHVEGFAAGDDQAEQIAQLTQLKSLTWGSSPLTPAALQELTALQGLTQLSVAGGVSLEGQLGVRGADNVQLYVTEVSADKAHGSRCVQPDACTNGHSMV